MALTDDLRAVAKKLLSSEGDGRVDVVIGHAKGTLPLRSTPLFARTPDEAEALVTDATCGANLVRHLRGRTDRAAVVAKACDARSLVEALKEKQLDPERFVVIAVPCPGAVDMDAVVRATSAPELLAGDCNGSEVKVRTRDGEKTLAFADVLSARCRTCETREVALPDSVTVERIEIAEGDAAAAPGGRSALEEFQAKTPEERWAHFAEQASKCILCYACRNACPLCYCEECFVEGTQPAWLGREHNLSNQQVYQLMRALHLAGRCVGCGDCMRACPMGVDLGVINDRLREDVKELYGAEPGADAEAAQPLAAYEMDDWQEFMM
ncbi:MAG: 4Fe-4S dicluster domain-containing protein [Planctomycetota bacterium]|jgi:ferredoxin